LILFKKDKVVNIILKVS